jgi:hypothetical protein
MRLWRIGSALHQVWSGEGARLKGGRWNQPGTLAIYAATSHASAALEILVHGNIGRVPRGFRCVTIDIPDDAPIDRVAPDAVRILCVRRRLAAPAGGAGAAGAFGGDARHGLERGGESVAFCVRTHHRRRGAAGAVGSSAAGAGRGRGPMTASPPVPVFPIPALRL